jgi:hypothetical protein
MKKKVPFTKSSIYVNFTNERDRVLEKILHVHLNAIDNIVRKMKKKVLTMGHERRFVDAFVRNSTGPLRHEFDLAAVQVSKIAERLRAESYFFAHISEAEAMGRTLGKPQRYYCHTKTLHAKPMHDGVNLQDRMQLALNRLRSKVEDAYSLSVVQQSNREETDKRVTRAFPITRPKPKTTRALKKHVREAGGISSSFKGQRGQDIFSMNYGFADDDLWDEVLDDYTTEELPDSIYARGPEDKTLFYDVTTETNEERYSWEVENEVTEDFVRSVRSGTQDAASENGITDFMWIAILDKVTDECCRVRDGQSSSDIENALDEGKIDEDECDAIVPPGHFNCRCKSAPMADDIPDTDMSSYNSLDDWLTSKGQES